MQTFLGVEVITMLRDIKEVGHLSLKIFNSVLEIIKYYLRMVCAVKGPSISPAVGGGLSTRPDCSKPMQHDPVHFQGWGIFMGRKLLCSSPASQQRISSWYPN